MKKEKEKKFKPERLANNTLKQSKLSAEDMACLSKNNIDIVVSYSTRK
jgi:hypothetical protein